MDFCSKSVFATLKANIVARITPMENEITDALSKKPKSELEDDSPAMTHAMCVLLRWRMKKVQVSVTKKNKHARISSDICPKLPTPFVVMKAAIRPIPPVERVSS